MPWEYDLLSVVDFYYKSSGYAAQIEREWMHTRYIAATLWNITPRKSKKAIQPSELVPLPSDAAAKRLKTKQMREEAERIKKKMQERHGDREFTSQIIS